MKVFVSERIKDSDYENTGRYGNTKGWLSCSILGRIYDVRFLIYLWIDDLRWNCELNTSMTKSKIVHLSQS